MNVEKNECAHPHCCNIKHIIIIYKIIFRDQVLLEDHMTVLQTHILCTFIYDSDV